ncbi:hypothetical protein [Moorena sp. SIO3H5]|nr:hypothetical protein [Moorena sp. SIO3H5]
MSYTSFGFSGIGNRESGIGNRESGIGKKYCVPDTEENCYIIIKD